MRDAQVRRLLRQLGSGKRWYRFQKLERAVLAFEPSQAAIAPPPMHCLPRRGAGHGRDAATYQGAGTNPAPLDAKRTWHVPADKAAIPGADRRSTPTEPRVVNSNQSTRIRAGRAPFSSSSRCSNDSGRAARAPGACGAWSVREVVHCAGWEWEAARRLRLIAADPTLPDAVYKVEGFNAASVAARARQDWSRTLDELAKASNTLARAARAMPDDARTQEWLVGRGRFRGACRRTPALDRRDRTPTLSGRARMK